jgi:hypothetical protein
MVAFPLFRIKHTIIFTSCDDVVSIRIKYIIVKYLIGSVEYVERVKIEQFMATQTFTGLALGGQPHKFAKTLCIKRPEFSHENEVRLLFNDAQKNKGKNRVASFSFDPDVIISEVALDPRLATSEFQQEKSRLINAGCKIPIIQSDLYQVTPTMIKFD